MAYVKSGQTKLERQCPLQEQLKQVPKKNSPPVGSELSDSMLFAYPVAQEGAQDVDNQKEWEVADALGQSGGRGKIGGSYI